MDMLNHFDKNNFEDLKKVITPNWNDKNLRSHLNMMEIPEHTKRILEIGCGIGRLLKPLSE